MGNFAWRKACTVLKVRRQEVVDAGWPLTLSATVLSWLQFTERADRHDLERELLSECAKGAIPFIEVKALHRTIQITRRPITFSSVDWMGYPTEGKLVQTAVSKEVMVRQIAPADFKGWLAAQNMAPSEHIAAWFDAMMPVDVAKTVGPLPVNDDETIEARNDRWLAHFEAQEKDNPDGATQRSADHFAVERSTFGKAVKRAKAKRAERYRADIKAVPKKARNSVFDVPGTRVKEGKKTSI